MPGALSPPARHTRRNRVPRIVGRVLQPTNPPRCAATSTTRANASNVETDPLIPAPIVDQAPQPGRFGMFGFSHKHTASSAALLLGFFALVSRAIGLVRDKYIAYTFGAGAAKV